MVAHNRLVQVEDLTAFEVFEPLSARGRMLEPLMLAARGRMLEALIVHHAPSVELSLRSCFQRLLGLFPYRVSSVLRPSCCCSP